MHFFDTRGCHSQNEQTYLRLFSKCQINENLVSEHGRPVSLEDLGVTGFEPLTFQT